MIIQEIQSGCWLLRPTRKDGGRGQNTYLLDAGSCAVLLGSPPAPEAGEWASAIRCLLPGRELRYAALFGTPHDVRGLGALQEQFPDLTVIAGKALLFSLGELGRLPEKTIEIRSARTLKLGTRELAFSSPAALREAASLRVTDRESGLRFGADGCTAFEEEPKPAIKEKENALRRPVVAVVHSGSDSIRLLADRIEQGIRSHGEGTAPKVLDLDLAHMNRQEVLAALPGADAYLFGTEDHDDNAETAVWEVAVALRRRDAAGKRAAVFYTQYAGRQVPDALRAYLAALGMKLDMPDFFVEGKTAERHLKNAEDYGFGIGCCVLGIPNPRQPKLVRCLVCGEIFDASLGACPVCGVGLEQCQPVDEEEITYRVDTDRNYLIIGGCTAAVSAADAIRQRDKTGHITLLSSENYLPINRPMLIKEIDVVVSEPETIQAHPKAWYEERNLDFRLGCTATAIHPETKTVETSDGQVFPYDKLILATGAECFIPPIQGSDKPGVIAVRHFEDTKELFHRMETAKNAVVIGGGILGLEAAREFMRSGIAVTVLEATPQIMWRQIDATSSALLRKAMKKMHIDCFEGVNVAEIEGEEKPTGVRLSDGRVFPADVVVMSCGVKANTALAVAAGVKADRAIVVDMFMRTNVPDIYACGDCCWYDGVNYQLMAEASAQGRVAGAHAAGDRSVYFSNRLIGMHVEGIGATMFAIGDAGKNEKLSYKTVETQDEIRNRHETYWFSGGALKGAVVINADEKMQDVISKVETAVRYDDMF